MTLLGLEKKSQTFRNVLITTKVVQVLNDFEKSNHLTEQQKQILFKGADLVKKIIEGSTLVEGKQFKAGLSPTQEGLSAYGYALSTIDSLNILGKNEELTNFFEKLLTQLKEIEKVEKPKDIELLKMFFLTLGNAFKGDIQKERYTIEKHPLFKKDVSEDLSYA